MLRLALAVALVSLSAARTFGAAPRAARPAPRFVRGGPIPISVAPASLTAAAAAASAQLGPASPALAAAGAAAAAPAALTSVSAAPAPAEESVLPARAMFDGAAAARGAASADARLPGTLRATLAVDGDARVLLGRAEYVADDGSPASFAFKADLSVRDPADRAATTTLDRLLEGKPRPKFPLSFELELPAGWSSFFSPGTLVSRTESSEATRERWTIPAGALKGENGPIIAFARFLHAERRAGVMTLRFHLDRDVEHPRPSDVIDGITRAVASFQGDLGAPAVLSQDIILLDSAQVGVWPYMRLGRVLPEQRMDFDYFIAHEPAHYWWDEATGMWATEGTAQFYSDRFMSREMGYDAAWLTAREELETAVQTQLRGLRYALGDPKYRHDLMSMTVGGTIHHNYGALVLKRLAERAGLARTLRFLKGYQVRRRGESQRSIDTFLEDAKRELPRAHPMLVELLKKPPVSRIRISPPETLAEEVIARRAAGDDLVSAMNALLALQTLPAEAAWRAGASYLSSKNHLLRTAAMIGLARHARDRAEAGRVTATLRQRDVFYPLFAEMALGVAASGNPLIEEELIALLQAGLPPRSRLAVAQAIARFKSDRGMEVLFTALSGTPTGRFHLLASLADAGEHPRARAFLLERIQDPSPAHKDDAAIAMVGLRRARAPVPAAAADAMLDRNRGLLSQAALLSYLDEARPGYRCGMLADPRWTAGDPSIALKLAGLKAACP